MRFRRNHLAVLVGLGSGLALIAGFALWIGEEMIAAYMAIAFLASAMALVDPAGAAPSAGTHCSSQAASEERN